MASVDADEQHVAELPRLSAILGESMIDRLAARVFATRNAAHLAHWKTPSYAQHMALGEFYDAIIDGIDEIVEVYQGAKGLIDVNYEAVRPVGSVIEHIAAEAAWIAQNREQIANGVPAVLNLVDELQATYLKTLYKLKNLK